MYYLLTSHYNEFPFKKVNGLLVKLYERCELEAQNPLPMAAVLIKNYQISERWGGPFKSLYIALLYVPSQFTCYTYMALKLTVNFDGLDGYNLLMY